jgi:hypothetical protein
MQGYRRGELTSMKIVATLGIIVFSLILSVLVPVRAFAGQFSGHEGFELGVQSGYGGMHLRSDQGWDVDKGTFSLGFQGGYAVSSRMIVGLEVGGWLLESFSFDAHGDEEEKGEAVSNTLLFLHLFPVKRLPFYLRAALGHAHYKNNRWDGNGGGGWGSWLIGTGWEIPMSGRFWVAPQVSYCRGSISDVPVILGEETGRQFHVVDLSIAMHWYSGK